ncbi:MAG: hypothetical protein OHK0019_26430 [Saprospiraceae bacterium]
MKIFKSPPPRTALLFVIAALLTLNIISCDRDQTDTPQTTVPLSDVPVTSRACTGTANCELTVSSTDEMTIEFCGAIDPSTTTCNFGCDPDNDVYYGVYVPANQGFAICVDPNGSVCIRNAPTAYADHYYNCTVWQFKHPCQCDSHAWPGPLFSYQQHLFGNKHRMFVM